MTESLARMTTFPRQHPDTNAARPTAAFHDRSSAARGTCLGSARRVCAMLVFTSVLFSWFTSTPHVCAQEAESYSIGGLDPDLYTLTEPAEELAEGGFGAWFQAGYTAGQSIDLNESVFQVEASPYMFVEEGMFFGSARFFRTNTADWGGSGGAGYRHYFQGIDRLFGASVWYDRDGSRGGSIFEQVGASFETLGENFDFRTNLYYPIGTEERQLDLFVEPGSFEFQGFNLLYDQTRVIGEALKGLDMELGMPINQEVAKRHNVRLYGGWYYFLSDNTDDVIGWKTRIEANPIPSVTLDLALQDDEVFGTSVNFSVAWTFDPHNLSKSDWHKSTWDRMTMPVARNRAVVVSEQRITEEDIVAINPATGNPYIIRHVNSTAAGVMDGTFENPFDQIQDATTQGGNDLNYDIVYVHADSVFNGVDATVITDANKRMLGEADGITHFVNIAGFGNQPLPRATTGSNRPQLIGAPGDSVTLASGSEFSGFIIDSPVGNGVTINGTTGGTMRFVDINSAGGNGILMTNPTGTFLFESVNISDSVGNAFEVVGGNANVTYTDSSITNTSGRALLIDGTTGGFINMTGTTIDDDGGEGILITNTAGSVTIDTATINNSTTTGVDINNTTGRVSFVGVTTIDDAAGIAMNMTDIAASSIVTINTLNINNRNDTGINLERIAGSASFIGASNLGSSNVDGFAIEFQESSGLVAFNSIDIENANGFGSGIHIGNTLTDNTNTSSFTVAGATTMDALEGTSIFIEDDDSTVRFDGPVTIDYQAVDPILGDPLAAIAVYNNRGNVIFSSTTTMDGTDGTAIDIFNNSGATAFAVVDIDAGTVPDGEYAVEMSDNTASVSFQSLSVEADGSLIGAFDNTSISISGGVLDTTGGAALNVFNTGTTDLNDRVINIEFEEIQADGSGSVEPAIVILNATGSFTIDGTNQSEISNYILNTNPGNPLFPEINQVGGIVIAEIDDGDDSIDADDDEVLEVNLNNLLMEGNNSAIVARNVDELIIDELEFNDSINQGIIALNTRFFMLTNSGGQENAGPLEEVISLLYNTVRDDDEFYEAYFMQNTLGNIGLSDTDSTLINIQAVNTISNDVFIIGASGDGIDSDTDNNQEMDLLVEITDGNIFTFENDFDIDDLAAINIEWNGRLNATIGNGDTSADRNFFNLGSIDLAGDLIGINIENDTDETDEDTDVVIENNTFQINSNDGNTAVMNFDIEEELDVLIFNNVSTTLTQTENITNFGTVFDIGADSDVIIASNTFTLGPDAGIAVLFDRIQGPSRVNISDNIFNLQDLNLGGPLEQGVIFTTVFGTVSLDSTVGNTLNLIGLTGTEIIFSAPANSTTGSININGVNFP